MIFCQLSSLSFILSSDRLEYSGPKIFKKFMIKCYLSSSPESPQMRVLVVVVHILESRPYTVTDSVPDANSWSTLNLFKL
jgi:hypothetical protein